MKYCQSCGKQLNDEATFCTFCGAKQGVSAAPHIPTPPVPPVPPVAPVKPGRGANGLGIAGFVISIIAIIFSWIPVLNVAAMVLGAPALILPFVGLIVGICSRKRLGLAITGLILSIFAIVIGILVVVGIASL